MLAVDILLTLELRFLGYSSFEGSKLRESNVAH